MLVTIHQPQFMPWLGYFDKMDRADLFILLDTVQFKKNEWQNRNRVKTVQGPQWLTVPVRYRFPARIDEVGVNDDVSWRHKHVQTLKTNYSRAAFWEEHAASLTALYDVEEPHLRQVNAASIDWLAERLGVRTERRWASDFKVATQDPTQRLIDLCREAGATTYLSGADGRNYLEVDRFTSVGIEVIFQEYAPVEYPQLFGEFVSHLSALDLLLNAGPGSADVLRAGRIQT
jgi:hypothetical protein